MKCQKCQSPLAQYVNVPMISILNMKQPAQEMGLIGNVVQLPIAFSIGIPLCEECATAMFDDVAKFGPKMPGDFARWCQDREEPSDA